MNFENAGWHVVYDAHTDSSQSGILASGNSIKGMLLDLVKLLDMKVLVGPVVEVVPCDQSKLDSEEDEGGVTGFCVITTSHISIHTWPLRQRFSLDIFSCKPFNRDDVDKFLKERLHVTTRWMQNIQRIWPSGKFEPGRPETNDL